MRSLELTSKKTASEKALEKEVRGLKKEVMKLTKALSKMTTMATKAEGLATRCAFELTQDLLRRHLDDFVLDSEREMNEAVRILMEKTRNLAEPSGAAALAAAAAGAARAAAHIMTYIIIIYIKCIKIK